MMTSVNGNKGRPPDCVNKGKQPDSKLVVMGNPGVGKSALVVRFLTNRFIWEYDPTLEKIYKHQTLLDEESTLIEILDTAGQVSTEENCIHQEGNIRWGDAFVLVYAINDRPSFEAVVALKQHLDQIKKTNVQCTLVGNKMDLLHERRVTYEEGEAAAQDMSCGFFETSASDGGEEIPELFYDLHRDVRRRKMAETKGRRRSSAQQVKNVFNRMLNKIGNSS